MKQPQVTLLCTPYILECNTLTRCTKTAYFNERDARKAFRRKMRALDNQCTTADIILLRFEDIIGYVEVSPRGLFAHRMP